MSYDIYLHDNKIGTNDFINTIGYANEEVLRGIFGNKLLEEDFMEHQQYGIVGNYLDILLGYTEEYPNKIWDIGL